MSKRSRDHCSYSLEPYKCKKCYFSTKLFTDIRKHRPKCSAYDAPKQTMENLMKKHPHQKPSYLCSNCPFTTQLFVDLLKHNTYCLSYQKHIQSRGILNKYSSKETSDNVWEKFQCYHCRFKTSRKHTLNSHIYYNHICAQVQKCKKCDFRTRLENDYREHLKTHETFTKTTCKQKAEKPEFQCQFCDCRTDDKIQLDTHMLTKHTLQVHVPMYECEHCDYKALSEICLKVHRKNVHRLNGPLWVPCKLCNFRAHHNVELEQHLLKEHGQTSRICTSSEDNVDGLFHCTNCKHKFHNYEKLKTHILVEHSRLMEWFKCVECSYKTNSKSAIEQHRNPSEVALKCEHCKFRTRNDECSLNSVAFEVELNNIVNFFLCYEIGSLGTNSFRTAKKAIFCLVYVYIHLLDRRITSKPNLFT